MSTTSYGFSIILHFTYWAQASCSFQILKQPDDVSWGYRFVDAALKLVFVIQALVFLVIFILKRRKSVSTYGILVNQSSKHALIAVTAFFMLASCMPYPYLFQDKDTLVLFNFNLLIDEHSGSPKSLLIAQLQNWRGSRNKCISSRILENIEFRNGVVKLSPDLELHLFLEILQF